MIIHKFINIVKLPMRKSTTYRIANATKVDATLLKVAVQRIRLGEDVANEGASGGQSVSLTAEGVGLRTEMTIDKWTDSIYDCSAAGMQSYYSVTRSPLRSDRADLLMAVASPTAANPSVGL